MHQHAEGAGGDRKARWPARKEVSVKRTDWRGVPLLAPTLKQGRNLWLRLLFLCWGIFILDVFCVLLRGVFRRCEQNVYIAVFRVADPGRDRL